LHLIRDVKRVNSIREIRGERDSKDQEIRQMKSERARMKTTNIKSNPSRATPSFLRSSKTQRSTPTPSQSRHTSLVVYTWLLDTSTILSCRRWHSSGVKVGSRVSRIAVRHLLTSLAVKRWFETLSTRTTFS